MRAWSVLWLAGWISLASAQDPLQLEARRKAILEGTHVFRRILHDEGFTALQRLEDLSEAPERSLLILFGDLEDLRNIPGGLAGFLDKGGAVLLASDRPVQSRRSSMALLDVAGVAISEHTLITPNFWECYQNRDYCPFAFPVLAGRIPLFLTDDGQPIQPVATNVPSRLLLRRLRPGLGMLSVLSANVLQQVGDELRPIEGWPVLALGGPYGKGRILVMADHSLFINEMMMPEDTGNVEFAVNAVRYLRDKKRDRVLFMEEGRIQTKLDLPLQSAQLNLDELLSLIYSRRNELLIEAENWLTRKEDEDNALNRWVVEAIDQRYGWDRFLFTLLILGTVGLGLYAVYRLWIRERYAPDTSVPLVVTAAAKVLPGKPLVEQRLDALLQLGDVREPMRERAREWLRRVGLTPPVDARQPLPAIITRGWWAAWGFRTRLARIWQMAKGEWPRRLQPRKLQEWQREMDALHQAHERGEWQVRGKG
jgi:hypothetical protein